MRTGVVAGLHLRCPAGVLALVAHDPGRSWLAVQKRHEVLSGGNRSDGEREGKSQLFESGHAENDSTAGRLRPGRLARLVCAPIEAAYGFSALRCMRAIIRS